MRLLVFAQVGVVGDIICACRYTNTPKRHTLFGDPAFIVTTLFLYFANDKDGASQVCPLYGTKYLEILHADVPTRMTRERFENVVLLRIPCVHWLVGHIYKQHRVACR